MREFSKEYQVDVLVIGAGPGGEGAAMRAAKWNRSVVMVEKHSQVGGASTHLGTIPSKALRHGISHMLAFNTNALFRKHTTVQLTFPELLKSAQKVIDQQVEMRTSFYQHNKIPRLHGNARFIDEHTVEVIDKNQEVIATVRAENIVIATGSRPYHPDDIDFSHPGVFDSDTILNITEMPNSIIIYGAGVIGCEYASMLRNIGCKVDLIDTRNQLLSFLDDDISYALSYHLNDQGVTIRHNEEFAELECNSDGVVMHLKSGKRIRAEALLWANGRTGNAQDLNLSAIGITPNQRGQLNVNHNYQTELPHIYAVGDIIGYPSLASAAYDQGRFAAGHMMNVDMDQHLTKHMPTGIYTLPEISCVGRTEKELTSSKIPYEVGIAYFKTIARAQITGQPVGMLKLLFHSDTLEILGVHCFGNQAAEIIHIGQAILSQTGEGNSLQYFINTTFNYPTMAEVYRVAAINGMNRLG